MEGFKYIQVRDRSVIQTIQPALFCWVLLHLAVKVKYCGNILLFYSTSLYWTVVMMCKMHKVHEQIGFTFKVNATAFWCCRLTSGDTQKKQLVDKMIFRKAKINWQQLLIAKTFSVFKIQYFLMLYRSSN